YAAGSLIKQICDAKGLSPEEIVYIECNPETGSKLSFYDEEFFKVDFELDNGMPVNLRYSQLNEEQIRSYFDF
ncbi:MAG: class I SAM-dependent methyltransferase, partial [Bacteroidales bacterium]|nr:class I SAM-dependent methyltransferase [Bacteroidales bacterium]